MGYFENLAETAFKIGTSGEIHFHRWGVFGKPYIVPSSNQKEEVKRFLIRFYQISLPLGIFAGIFMKWMALPLIPFFLLYYEIGIRQRIKGWDRSNEKLTIGQAYSNASRIWPPAFLWFGTITFGLLILAGLFILWKTDKIWLGTLCVILFGMLLAANVKMLVSRKGAVLTKDPQEN